MKTVVITGSTRGIGLGLAEAFLARGCRVVINGRSPASVEKSVAALGQTYPAEQIAGQAGDVVNLEDNQAIWDTAVSRFGPVDIWINNAGVGHPMQPVWELPESKVHQLVDINMKGLIFGAQVAIRGMLAQGHGHLYNMEGFGSNGRMRPGISLYGSTKSAVRFISRSLTQETAETAVQVSTLSPGIVITDFLSEQYQDDPEGFAEAKRIFNALGDKVETVCPWLVDQILDNKKSGARINWLSPGKAMKRLALMRFSKRDLFAKDA